MTRRIIERIWHHCETCDGTGGLVVEGYSHRRTCYDCAGACGTLIENDISGNWEHLEAECERLRGIIEQAQVRSFANTVWWASVCYSGSRQDVIDEMKSRLREIGAILRSTVGG